jgi:YggT family protein
MLVFSILLDIAAILLNVLWWIILIQVILSWLVAFNVINTSSDGVRRFIQALDRILEPLYRPIRKILPDFGGLDLSPLVLIIIIMILQGPVIGNLRNALPPSGM